MAKMITAAADALTSRDRRRSAGCGMCGRSATLATIALQAVSQERPNRQALPPCRGRRSGTASNSDAERRSASFGVTAMLSARPMCDHAGASGSMRSHGERSTRLAESGRPRLMSGPAGAGCSTGLPEPRASAGRQPRKSGAGCQCVLGAWSPCACRSTQHGRSGELRVSGAVPESRVPTVAAVFLCSAPGKGSRPVHLPGVIRSRGVASPRKTSLVTQRRLSADSSRRTRSHGSMGPWSINDEVHAHNDAD